MKAATDSTNDLRVRLEEELARTIARLRALGAEVSPELADLTGDSLTESFENAEAHAARESLFASRERLAARAESLAAALGRLRVGTYGTCTECGEPIGAARLRAIPEVTTCVSCQERLDRERAWQRGTRRVPSDFERELDEVPQPAASVPLDETVAIEALPEPNGTDEREPRGERRGARKRRRATPERARRRAAA